MRIDMGHYFFTESYTYKQGVAASISGGTPAAGHLPPDAIDYDKASYCETDGANPELVIDLGVARTVDSLWLKHDNIETIEVYHSSDGIAWTETAGGDGVIDMGDGILWYFGFTAQSKRYWKIKVATKAGAGNVKFYEAMLMELKLTLEDDIDLPADVRVDKVDTIGGHYVMADGSTLSYAGQRIFARIAVMFQYTPKANKDALEALFASPIRQALTIVPDEAYPENIYRAIWQEADFKLNYSIPYKPNGFSGELNFIEY